MVVTEGPVRGQRRHRRPGPVDRGGVPCLSPLRPDAHRPPACLHWVWGGGRWMVGGGLNVGGVLKVYPLPSKLILPNG